MAKQNVLIQLPSTLLERAHVPLVSDAQNLVTFLLEVYVHKIEKKELRKAYEAYYSARTREEETEELEFLAEFAFADAEATNLNDEWS
jgi:hypothetical protein